ncbi:MAG: hypothetical protein PHT60_03885 [Acidiphilium sp.]|nr:hypothetical protein [Acidiphilium sp.]MDD4934898.1 hypothetical protein [Acidiphilium sp.]
MKIFIRAGFMIVAAAMAPAPAAWAADQNIAVATSDMTQMLGAIGHPDYATFVEAATPEFKASVDATKFGEQTKMIDSKIPLDQPYTVKFITTQKVGAFLNYIFEVTLHNGDQVLTSLNLQDGKVAGFHLL